MYVTNKDNINKYTLLIAFLQLLLGQMAPFPFASLISKHHFFNVPLVFQQSFTIWTVGKSPRAIDHRHEWSNFHIQLGLGHAEGHLGQKTLKLSQTFYMA